MTGNKGVPRLNVHRDRARSRRTFCAGLLAAVMVFQAPAAAIALRAEPFITAKQLDLTHYLPAPPPEDSERAKAEIAEVLEQILIMWNCIQRR